MRALLLLTIGIAQVAAGYLLYAARMLGHSYATTDAVAFHLPLIVGAAAFRATLVGSSAVHSWPPGWRNAALTLTAIALAFLAQVTAMSLGANRYGS